MSKERELLSAKSCFKPQHNSMAEFVELSPESIRQENMQKEDTGTIPYDIYEIGKGAKIQECLNAMDEEMRMLTKKWRDKRDKI